MREISLADENVYEYLTTFSFSDETWEQYKNDKPGKARIEDFCYETMIAEQ